MMKSTEKILLNGLFLHELFEVTEGEISLLCLIESAKGKKSEESILVFEVISSVELFYHL